MRGHFYCMARGRAIFYYDGFNFYKGLREVGWKDCYWLDLYQFSKNILEKYKWYEITHIHYFTCRPFNRGKTLRQGIWLNTNEKLHPEIEVHYGKKESEKIKCTNPRCNRIIQIPREKETDVNIAVNMMYDCIKENCDVSVLVSGDNDYVPILRYIKNHHPKQRIHNVYPPYRNLSSLHMWSGFQPIDLIRAKDVLLKSRLPKKVNFSDGTFSIMPPEWDL